MEDNPCRYCVKPKRQPGCHDHCKERKEWKAVHDAKCAEDYKHRKISCDIYSQRSEQVTKATKRHGRK